MGPSASGRTFDVWIEAYALGLLSRLYQSVLTDSSNLRVAYLSELRTDANQGERADNVLPGSDKQVHLDQIRKDIRDFKANNDLEQVIVLWTANTER